MIQKFGIIEISSEEEYRNMKRHAINHFYEKLLKIKDSINTDKARKIAEQRTKYMEEFLTNINLIKKNNYINQLKNENEKSEERLEKYV